MTWKHTKNPLMQHREDGIRGEDDEVGEKRNIRLEPGTATGWNYDHPAMHATSTAQCFCINSFIRKMQALCFKTS
jgi:hypothetical protein